jgi:hypothetical protein
MGRLMTAEEVVTEWNLPSTRTVRTMRAKGMPFVRLGKAYLYDAADVQHHIDRSKVVLCPAQIAAPRSSGSTSGSASTSSGMREGGGQGIHVRRSQSRHSRIMPRPCGAG